MSRKTTVANANALRRAMTYPEVLLWGALRARPGGLKFRRQHAAGPYVLDFYCAQAGLCIEVDGIAHEMGSNPRRDARRDAWLLQQGIRTVRIPAKEVIDDVTAVIQLIQEECASRSPSTGFAGPPPLEIEGRMV